MRVLVVGLSGILGGVEREVLSIVEECSDCICFDFLCFGENYQYESQYKDYVFYYIPRRRENYFESQKQQKQFWKTNGKKYDVVWINTSSASNLTSYEFAKKYSNAKIVSHSHGSRIEHNSRLLRIIHILLHVLKRRRLVALSETLVACSNNAAKHLYGASAIKAIVVHNGIDVKRFLFDLDNRNAIREELNIGKNDVVLMCIGRVEKVKNFLYAIKVYQSLYEKTLNKQFKMIIIGNGSEYNSIEDYIVEHNLTEVKLLGYKSDIKPYLDASDVFLLPSLFEGFPVAVVEAQANGLPCIVSNKVTSEVKITDLVSFIGISDRDAEEWVNNLLNIELLRDRIKFNEMVFNAGYDVHYVASKMKGIFFGDEN